MTILEFLCSGHFRLHLYFFTKCRVACMRAELQVNVVLEAKHTGLLLPPLVIATIVEEKHMFVFHYTSVASNCI